VVAPMVLSQLFTSVMLAHRARCGRGDTLPFHLMSLPEGMSVNLKVRGKTRSKKGDKLPLWK